MKKINSVILFNFQKIMKILKKFILSAVLFAVLSLIIFTSNKFGFSGGIIQTAKALTGSQVYDVAGTYTFTVPDDFYSDSGNGVRIEAWGGGGAGGTGIRMSRCLQGKGGGGGAYGEAFFDVESGDEFEVVVGEGGLPCSLHDGCAGNPGGKTSFTNSLDNNIFLSVEGGWGGGIVSVGSGGSLIIAGGNVSLLSDNGEDGVGATGGEAGQPGGGAGGECGIAGGFPGGGSGGGASAGGPLTKPGASGKVIIYWEKIPICGDGIISGNEKCDTDEDIGCADPDKPFCNGRCTFCVCSESRLVFLDKPIICTVQDLILFLLSIIGGIALLMIVFSGILYTFSGTDPEAQNKAKRTFNYAIIGLIFVLISYAIIKIITEVSV